MFPITRVADDRQCGLMNQESVVMAPGNLTESVLLRPKMYTMNGSYEECISFLKGYYGGAAKVRPFLPDVEEWGLFREWLAAQLQVGQSDVFVTLRERSANGEEALKQLANMAGRFRAIK